MQKYSSGKPTFESTIVQAELWVCCVDNKGKKKAVWVDEEKAWKRVEEHGGYIYACMFHDNQFHVTTRLSPRCGPSVAAGLVRLSNSKKDNQVERQVVAAKIAAAEMSEDTELVEALIAKRTELVARKNQIAKRMNYLIRLSYKTC